MSCDITLKKNGIRLTPQRRLIMDIIHDSGTGITGTEIMTRVNSRMPGVNKSTVYRTLDLLEKLECVFKNQAGGEFVYHHPEEGEHYHLVCRLCGASIDFAEDLLVPVEKAIEKQYGFQIDYRHVTIGGICPSCKEKTAK
jgi:Fur family ferric uptake transcriptional regulator